MIPSIVENPIKCLGKWFDDTLSDHRNVDNIRKQVADWLNMIDKTGLPGKYKAWMYQHGVLPRVTWPLTLYEFAVTTVETLERTINRKLRKWLGCHQAELVIFNSPCLQSLRSSRFLSADSL